MRSRKQKKEKKKSHRHRHRNRRAKSQKKNEPKKQNLLYATSAWVTDLRDITCYMGDQQEMISQMFSSVGDDFLSKSVPLILKGAKREELERICLEELRKLSADDIFKILEGIPIDTQSNYLQERNSKENYHGSSSNICRGQVSTITTKVECASRSDDCDKQQLSFIKLEDVKFRCNEQPSEPLESSSSEENHSDSEVEEINSSEDEICFIKSEASSSSTSQPSITKKLAKVAPFHISISNPEIGQPTSIQEEGGYSSDIETESSYEVIDLGLEEAIDNEEDETDLVEEQDINGIFSHSSDLDEDSNMQEVTEGEIQQNISQMLELEHRARAIQSFVANIDRFQE